MKTSLIICTYNRPEYFKRCLASVEALEEKPDEIIIVDDMSTDIAVRREIIDTKLELTVLNKDKKSGIKGSLLDGFSYAFKKGYDLAINLDSDAIVKPNFITRLKDLKNRFHDHIISGFNCNHPKNPIISEGEDYVHRRHCNGINMCIDKGQYKNIVHPALLSHSNWDFNCTHYKTFIISKPSLVQHLAPNDSTMGHVGGDVACDY